MFVPSFGTSYVVTVVLETFFNPFAPCASISVKTDVSEIRGVVEFLDLLSAVLFRIKF